MRPKSTPVVRTCARCGESFEQAPWMVPTTFCGRTCSNMARRASYTPPCAYCGVPLTRRKGHRVGTFCSPACRNKGAYAPLSDRLWKKIDKNGPLPERHPEYGPCWLWTGGQTSNGYGSNGMMDEGVKVSYLVHRKSWELVTDTVLTTDDVIGHTCDIRLCVRNDTEGVYEVRGVLLPRRGHLFLGTDADNMQDAKQKGRLFNLGAWVSEHPEEAREATLRWRREQPEVVARGEAAGMSKLTEDEVRYILRALRDKTESGAGLARRFNVHPQNITFIRQRKTWKHVEI